MDYATIFGATKVVHTEHETNGYVEKIILPKAWDYTRR